MKSAILFAIFLFGLVEANARIGMGEIQFKTPGGHIICDCDPYTETPVLIGFESSIKNLERWYFYKNHIIGSGKKYYFIFNETTKHLQLFQDEETWQHAIVQQHLAPFFTRWLNIYDSIEALYTTLVLGMFIWIPLILIIGTGCFMFFYITGLNKRKVVVSLLLLFAVTIIFIYRINIYSF